MMVLEGFEKYVPKFEYKVVDMNEVDVEKLLEMKNALAGLMCIDGMGRKDLEKAMERVRKVFREMEEEEKEMLRRYMRSMFIAVMGERGKELEGIEELEEMFVGLKKGIEREIKRAKEEGIEEGMEKGLVEARREDILELVRLKFGDVSDEMKGKIITLEDVAKLNEVFKLAVIAKDMEEFEGKVKEVI